MFEQVCKVRGAGSRVGTSKKRVSINHRFQRRTHQADINIAYAVYRWWNATKMTLGKDLGFGFPLDLVLYD